MSSLQSQAEKRRARFSGNAKKRLKAIAVEEEKLEVEKQAAAVREFFGDEDSSVIVQFSSSTTSESSKDDKDNDAKKSPSSLENVLSQVDIPVSSTPEELEDILNTLLETSATTRTPYTFYLGDNELLRGESLAHALMRISHSKESTVNIRYQPLSVYRVKPVTRLGGTLPGHLGAILHLSFSPDGTILTSGGGDNTVRFWDNLTCTPLHNFAKFHRSHVLCTSWSPDGRAFISSDYAGKIFLWRFDSRAERDAKLKRTSGVKKFIPRELKGHRKHVGTLWWEPCHLNEGKCERFVSGSKDGTAKIWNIRKASSSCMATLSGHSDAIECVRWGGSGLLYTCSRDRLIIVHALKKESNQAIVVKILKGHAHRINSLTLNCDYICRTGAFDPSRPSPDPKTSTCKEMQSLALTRYKAFVEGQDGKAERLVSCSDDFTLILWHPTENKKPIARLTGHQQIVNHMNFSPCGRYIASCGFDKKIKIWNGFTGAFIATLTGHVGPVYVVKWSSDSRYLASCSRDSTARIWSIGHEISSNTKNNRMFVKAKHVLSGHFDEVFALAWNSTGHCMASGSKDRTIKLWRE
eukprot:g2516.t1